MGKQTFEFENTAGLRQAAEELESCDRDSRKYIETMGEVAKESGVGSFMKAADDAAEAQRVFGAKCREIAENVRAVAKDYGELEDELQ